MAWLMEARDITLRFGGLAVLERLTIGVQEGEIVGLIGPNGSGKTTFINVLTKIYSPDEGSIHLRGEKIDHLPAYRVAEKGIARTFQNLRIFRNVSVLDNVIIGRHNLIKTSILGMFSRPLKHLHEEREAGKKAMELLKLVGLSNRATELAKNLPYGEQRRLELARSLATEPSLLLLDEPTAGMNPNEGTAMIGLFREINQMGISVLIIEHNMKTVMSISDRVLVLNAGRIICEGKPSEVQNNEKVQEVYLGKEES